MSRATSVELNAMPKLSVMPAMSPANAWSAWDSAWPMPRTVPMKPIDGIAQIR